MNRILTLSISAALLVFPALAQRGGGGGRGGNSPGMDIQVPRVTSRLEQISNMFKLSKDQRKEVKEIFDDAQKEAVPVREEMTKERLAIGEAVAGGKAQEEVDKATQAYGVSAAHMTAIELKAFVQVVDKLDDDQKQRAAGLYRMMPGMFHGKNWDTQ
ncbi:MAG TPA: hypothetical protein VGF59_20920 [Bryobacteraceae bacterium]